MILHIRSSLRKFNGLPKFLSGSYGKPLNHNMDDLSKIESGTVLLRRLTLKSIMKFGKHEHLTVQEIINLLEHDYLLWVYYHASNIDFNEEVKEYLRISLEREIKKPGKDPDKFKQCRGIALREIIDRDKTYDESSPDRFFVSHNRKAVRKTKIVSNCIRQNKEKSRIHNRDRNQKH